MSSIHFRKQAATDGATMDLNLVETKVWRLCFRGPNLQPLQAPEIPGNFSRKKIRKRILRKKTRCFGRCQAWLHILTGENRVSAYPFEGSVQEEVLVER